jgi:hypothetical protein
MVNSKVLITGGKSGDSILGTAETYDIAAGTFAATAGAMSSNRSRHTATLLPSGKVLIAGGQNSVSVNNTAETYDPATDAFSPTATTMTTPRDGHTATLLLNGKVLVAGGIDGNAVTSSAEIYDPATGQFTATGSMTTARVFHTATRLASGLVLIAGGFNGNYLGTAEIFDPATGTFRATAGAMTSRRGSHTATLLSDGNVLLAGGSDSTGALSSSEIYSPSSDSFAAVASAMTSARSGHTATLLADGTVMIAGGANGSDVLNTSEIYDPVTQSFQSAGTMTSARSGHTATFLQVSVGGYVRISSTPGLLFTEFFGRGNDAGALNGIDVEKYSAVTKVYAPQFAITSGFNTLLNLINANPDDDAQVNLVLHAPDGRVIGTPRALALPKGAQLKDDLKNIFQQDPSVQNTTGWLEILSSVDRVVGAISFTDSDGTFLTSFELSGTPLTHFVFPMAAEDSTYQTGIAILNSNDQSATVTMELWKPEGVLERSATLKLSPGTRTALYLSDYFPGLTPRLVGNIRIRSDQPVHSFSLMNDRSFHFLSAVPAIPFP